jgi:hypothetical protein
MPISLSLKGYTNEIDFPIFRYFRLQIVLVFNEFEAELQKVPAIVTGTFAELIYVQNLKSISLACLFNDFTINTHTGLWFGFIMQQNITGST